MASVVHTQTHALAPWANATAQVVLVDLGATEGQAGHKTMRVSVQRVSKKTPPWTGGARHGLHVRQHHAPSWC